MSTASLYTTMAGLEAITARMQATASNMANVQTPGYGAIQAATEAAPYAGPNAPGGADVVALTPGPDTRPGPLTRTGDPFTVGIGGDAWLQVQTQNGPALTRNGNLQITNAGLLADSAGNPLLNATGQPISLPVLQKMEIGTDGTVSGIPASGGGLQTYGQIGLVATPPVGQLSPLGGSLFALAPGAATQPAANGSLSQGFLNGSTVDPTKAMIDMIADSRSYQLQTDLMKTQSGNQGLNNLLAQG